MIRASHRLHHPNSARTLHARTKREASSAKQSGQERSKGDAAADIIAGTKNKARTAYVEPPESRPTLTRKTKPEPRPGDSLQPTSASVMDVRKQANEVGADGGP